MLKAMGWNKGSGLGKEQHGSVDFIQVRYKNNANGLGFNGLKDDQWTENESNFDDLLKSLNNANSNPGSNSGSGDEQLTTKKKSLEEKSKLSRARVHYKKFTKGKDVHKYSEKDLANILGKKTLKEVAEKEKPEEVIEEEEDDK
jgi:Pin2-interacting protein X1